MLEQLFGLLGGGSEQPAQGAPAAPAAAPAPQFDQRTLQLAEAYGLPPLLVQQAQQQSQTALLGNIGATLLAAGQAGPVGQRGQILSRMDLSAGDPSRSLLNSAQMRMYAQSMKEKQDASNRAAQARAALAKMEMTPELKALAQIDPEAAVKLIEGERSATRRAELGARVQYDAQTKQLIESGVSEPLARGIASGRYVVQKDPVDGTSKVVDIAQAAMSTGQPPQTVPVSQQPSPLPRTSVDGIAPLDYALATGGTGWIGNALNTAAGALGVPAYDPNTERAIDALNSLRMRTITEMSAAIPGRDTNQVRSYMEQRTVAPASITMGDSRALSRMEQVRNDIGAEIIRLNNLIQSGGIKATEISNVRSNLSNLQALHRDYNVVIDNWGRQQPAAAGQGGTPAPVASQGQQPQQQRIRIDLNGNIVP